jgi:hypothetical protein
MDSEAAPLLLLVLLLLLRLLLVRKVAEPVLCEELGASLLISGGDPTSVHTLVESAFRGRRRTLLL